MTLGPGDPFRNVGGRGDTQGDARSRCAHRTHEVWSLRSFSVGGSLRKRSDRPIEEQVGRRKGWLRKACTIFLTCWTSKAGWKPRSIVWQATLPAREKSFIFIAEMTLRLARPKWRDYRPHMGQSNR